MLRFFGDHHHLAYLACLVVPSVRNVGGGLPITGWPPALIAGSGAALLGAGALALLAGRRRHLHSSR